MQYKHLYSSSLPPVLVQRSRSHVWPSLSRPDAISCTETPLLSKLWSNPRLNQWVTSSMNPSLVCRCVSVFRGSQNKTRRIVPASRRLRKRLTSESTHFWQDWLVRLWLLDGFNHGQNRNWNVKWAMQPNGTNCAQTSTMKHPWSLTYNTNFTRPLLDLANSHRTTANLGNLALFDRQIFFLLLLGWVAIASKYFIGLQFEIEIRATTFSTASQAECGVRKRFAKSAFF